MTAAKHLLIWFIFLDISRRGHAKYVKQQAGEKKERFIVPGTKWCGHGDNAGHYHDFGTFIKTDKCCRQHDHCRTYILAGETKYGYKNVMTSTMSNCNCDKRFRRCLKKAKTMTADLVGTGYFLVQECFVLDKKTKTVKGTRNINY